MKTPQKIKAFNKRIDALVPLNGGDLGMKCIYLATGNLMKESVKLYNSVEGMQYLPWLTITSRYFKAIADNYPDKDGKLHKLADTIANCPDLMEYFKTTVKPLVIDVEKVSVQARCYLEIGLD